MFLTFFLFQDGSRTGGLVGRAVRRVVERRSKRAAIRGEDDASDPRGPGVRHLDLQKWIQIRRLRLEEEVFVLSGARSDGDRDPEPGAHRVAAQSHGIQLGECKNTSKKDILW